MFVTEDQIIDIRAIGLLRDSQMSHVVFHLLFYFA